MKPWTRVIDIRKKLEKKWNSGDLLARSVSSEPFAPLRIPLRRPNARELAHEFEAARTWVTHIGNHARTPEGFSIEWQEVNHRTLGRNRIPRAVIFTCLDDIFSYLGKTGEAARYKKRFKEITARFPGLAPLLMENCLEVLAHDRVWTELLAISAWVRDHPRPGIYLRQLEIPGVDTKFIETHKVWLTRLLNAMLPPEAIDVNARGKTAFEHRFGFKPKPARIRFRILDPSLFPMGLSDLEVTAEEFHHLMIRPDTLFVVENEITGLSLPLFPRAMVIIGLGYGLSLLSRALWMKKIPIWYWGDLDTHGFAMLDQIRHYFPQTRSFLMDQATLLSHRPFWGREPAPTGRDLPMLTPEEEKVYLSLKSDCHGPQLRLEQERISFSLVRQAIDGIRKK